MTSVQGRDCPQRERPSVTPSVTPFIALLSSSPSPESEFSEQPNGPPRPKSPAAATSVSKYFKDDMYRILKVVLEA